MKTYLTAEQIEDARELHKAGTPKSAIAQTFKLIHGVHRTTVYRHLNDDKTKYLNISSDKETEEKPVEYFFIQLAKEKDYTSVTVAEILGWELKDVNKYWL